MNKLRTDLSMPNNHQVLVTEGWLFGFSIFPWGKIRGWWKLSLIYFEGNVYVFYSRLLRSTTKYNEVLMYATKDFLFLIIIQLSRACAPKGKGNSK